eukprot:1149234-Pelagomonas_calceolata.AAC.2
MSENGQRPSTFPGIFTYPGPDRPMTAYNRAAPEVLGNVYAFRPTPEQKPFSRLQGMSFCTAF